jgi:hypothetical protein
MGEQDCSQSVRWNAGNLQTVKEILRSRVHPYIHCKSAGISRDQIGTSEV